jgi:hypothetical protein
MIISIYLTKLECKTTMTFGIKNNLFKSLKTFVNPLRFRIWKLNRTKHFLNGVTFYLRTDHIYIPQIYKRKGFLFTYVTLTYINFA